MGIIHGNFDRSCEYYFNREPDGTCGEFWDEDWDDDDEDEDDEEMIYKAYCPNCGKFLGVFPELEGEQFCTRCMSMIDLSEADYDYYDGD